MEPPKCPNWKWWTGWCPDIALGLPEKQHQAHDWKKKIDDDEDVQAATSTSFPFAFGKFPFYLLSLYRSFGFRHPRIEMGALRPWQHVESTRWQCGKMDSKDQQLEMQGSIQRMTGWTELEIHIKWNRYVEHAQGFTFLCLLCGTVFMQSKLCYAKRVHARRLLTWDLY